MQDRMESRVYAGFFVRWVAFIIDSLVAFIAAGIIKIPFGLAAGAGLTALRSNFIFQYSFIDVIGYVGMAAYFILITYFTHTTLGKMLLNLEVVTERDEWTFLNILYRETVGRFLSGIMCIGYLAVLISSRHQGFHDMLCDTYVVYKNMQRVPAPDKLAVAGGPSVEMGATETFVDVKDGMDVAEGAVAGEGSMNVPEEYVVGEDRINMTEGAVAEKSE